MSAFAIKPIYFIIHTYLANKISRLKNRHAEAHWHINHSFNKDIIN